jgi:hypothetical protein
MLIRVALWMIVLCLPIFLLAKMLLIFTFIVFAAFATQLAAFLLLAAFGLLIFGGLFGAIKKAFWIFYDFISAKNREQRHVLFVKNKQVNQKRLFYFKRIQLNYFKERDRKNLLEKNNQQHINALSKSIEQNLQQVKQDISKDLFLQLQLENRRYRIKQNEQALLKLHHKIATITGKVLC